MTLLVEKGTFAKTTTTTGLPFTQTVTLADGSLTPKLLILWTDGQTTNDGTYVDDSRISYGFSDGTNDACQAYRMDESAESESYTFRDDSVLCLISLTANSIVSQADVSSFNAGNFILNWSVQSDTNASVIHYMVAGGTDITNVNVLRTAVGDGVTGDHSYNGSGTTFTPDFALMFASADGYSATQLNTLAVGSDSGMFNIGAAKSTTKRWVMWGRDETVGTSDCDMYLDGGHCLATCSTSTGAVTFLADLVSFNNAAGGGITINVSGASPQISKRLAFLFVKGAVWDCGVFQQRSGTGTQDITTVTGLSSKGVFLGGINTANDATVTANFYVGIGASDGTHEGASFMGNTNGLGTFAAVHSNLNTKAYRISTPNATAASSTTDAECSVSSVATPGQFTLNWTTADTTLRRMVYWTVGLTGQLVAGTYTHVYNIHNLTSKTYTHKWNIINHIAQTFTHIYNILPLRVSQIYTHKHNIRNLSNTTYTHKWNIRNLLNKTYTHKWNIKALISQIFTHKWNIKNLVNQIFTHKYNIINFATKTFTHIYNIKNLTAQTYTHKYNIKNLIAQTFTHIHNIANLISQTFTHKYNIAALVSQTFTHFYNILGLALLVSNTFTHIYGIKNLANQTFTHKWNIKNLIAQTFTHRWNITNLVNKIFTHKWNIKNLVAQTYTHFYNISVLAAQTFTHIYGIKNLANATYTHIYNIINHVSQTFTHIYNILTVGVVNAVFIHKYNIKNLTAQTYSHKWNILTAINKLFTHRYNIRVAINNTFTHIHNIRNLAGQIFTHKWNIRNLATRAYAHKYNIRQFVNRLFTHRYKIKNLASQIFTHIYNITNVLTAAKTFIHRYNINNLVNKTYTHRYDIKTLSTILVTKIKDYLISKYQENDPNL